MNKKIYFLFVHFIFIYSTTLSAAIYDDDVLDIFSKILPRMILMSSQKHRVKDQIEICVLRDSVDETVATSFTRKMHDTYPNGIGNYPMKLTNSSYSNIDACQNSQMLFLLDTSAKNIEKALKYSGEHTSLTISYDSKYLENGVHASLFLGRKVTPYLNVNAARKNQIELDNLLIRISKIYLNEDEK